MCQELYSLKGTSIMVSGVLRSGGLLEWHSGRRGAQRYIGPKEGSKETEA